MITTLIILAVSAFFFAIGKIRSDIVALCALILLMSLGILTPEEALSGFSNSVVIMMAVMYGVSGYPTKIVIDRQGNILKRMVGESEDFYNYLDEILK